MKTLEERLVDAAYSGDCDVVMECLARGANINARDSFGDTHFHRLVFDLCCDRIVHRHEMMLLQNGADPKLLGEENSSILVGPMLAMDTEMLGVLLCAGVDPNAGIGFTDAESFYDYAEFDYRYTVYGDS